jgi:hypothetical protein
LGIPSAAAEIGIESEQFTADSAMSLETQRKGILQLFKFTRELCNLSHLHEKIKQAVF